MKAIILNNSGGTHNFELAEIPVPQPKENEVLVKIKASSFNPIDYQMRRGDKESALLKSSVLGREFAGEIVELGNKVQVYSPGDRVFAYAGSLASNGTYAEYISIPSELISKIPNHIKYENAASLPLIGLTALQCYQRLSLSAKKLIFIAGASGAVGIMLCKLLGLSRIKDIFATAGSEEAVFQLENTGIDPSHIINYKKTEVLAFLKSNLNGRQFDTVIDLVGGNFSEICAEIIDTFGTYVNVTGHLTEKSTSQLFDKGASIINISNYAPSISLVPSYDYYGKKLHELLNLIENNNIALPQINVIGELSLDTVQRAHYIMENNQSNGNKLIMINPF